MSRKRNVDSGALLHDAGDRPEEIVAPSLVVDPAERRGVPREVPGSRVGGEPDLPRRSLRVDDAALGSRHRQGEDVARDLAVHDLGVDMLERIADGAEAWSASFWYVVSSMRE